MENKFQSVLNVQAGRSPLKTPTCAPLHVESPLYVEVPYKTGSPLHDRKPLNDERVTTLDPELTCRFMWATQAKPFWATCSMADMVRP